MNILKLPAVMAKTGLCRSVIYERMELGTFPKSLHLGARSVGWLESELDEWIKSLIDERDNREAA